jgi:hypothetical protein
MCVVPHHEIARVDGVIYSTDPIFVSGCSRVLYVCFPYEVIRRMTRSIEDEHVMGCDVVTFIIRVHSACRIFEVRIHSIQTKVSEVGRCPCSGLTHGYHFYSER